MYGSVKIKSLKGGNKCSTRGNLRDHRVYFHEENERKRYTEYNCEIRQ